MNRFKLKFTYAADDDLDAIYEHIADTFQAPEAALRLVERIESTIKQLKSFPYSATKITDPKLINKEYRKLVIDKYVVIYRVDEKKQIVRIVRVFYGATNYHLEL